MKILGPYTRKEMKEVMQKMRDEANDSAKELKALDIQIAGNHYKNFKIQPFEFFIANQLPFHKADIIKRIMRYDLPTGKGLEDLEKSIHEIALIKEIEGWTK